MCRNNLDNRNACNGHDTCNVQTTTGRQRATDRELTEIIRLKRRNIRNFDSGTLN